MPKLKLRSHRIERFSRWSAVVRAIARLIHIAHSFASDKTSECCGWHMCRGHPTVADIRHAEQFIIRCVEQEEYGHEIDSITKGTSLSKNSSLLELNPVVDHHGLLNVGGHIEKSDLSDKEQNPIIPCRHYITTLLVRHYHEQVQHQRRQFTEGAIRSTDLWIVGMKRCVSSVLHKCIKCQKLRGKQQHQQMANLPADRLNTDQPFTYVGVDAFGPWSVITRRTRGEAANSKRWALLFTCHSIRAVHIEVIESMDSSCFINAPRRFFSLGGPAKQLRSDCGINFVGACVTGPGGGTSVLRCKEGPEERD
ncbi:uncharacterized protein [Phyllobates terribilis]|uniref:uncharacterized protein n=1 Tax=Phyllobates terribilis TaxID=111132 RepID=UPI003CCB1F7D